MYNNMTSKSVIETATTYARNAIKLPKMFSNTDIQKGTRKINTSIALYMPEAISNTYETKWEQGDMSGSMAATKTIDAVQNLKLS